MRLPGILLIIGALLFALPSTASAQTVERNDAWNKFTLVTTLSAAGSQLLMPRVFYSSPEVTVGWKARWHVSVLAPVMTLTALTLVHEYELKDVFEGARPGCDDTTAALPECQTFGMMSTHSLGAFQALGHGAAVFMTDTLSHGGGGFSTGSFIGNVAFPLVMAGVTAIGRDAGNYETGGQIMAGAGTGLLTGFLVGLMYATMQEPECGYSGSMLCW